jgi:hypothetical protein
MHIPKFSLKRLNTAFPYLLFTIGTAGFLVAYEYFGILFAIKSLGYVIPMIVVSIILLIRRKYKDAESGILKSIQKLKRISFLNILMVTVLLFVFSIILLIYFPTRPWAYFFVIALTSGSIFIQIFSYREQWTDNLIIFEIIVLSLNLIWGVVLKYPLFFGGTDIFGHMFNIETVLQTAHTTGLGTYVNFPLFHIYNAIGIEITGLDLRTGLFVFMGVAWVAGILITYLLFIKISNSGRFSLTACLLYAMSSVVVVSGMYTITRSLAFVLILGWIYLILNKDSFKYAFLSLITMSALILMHHTTIYLSIPILMIIYISQRIFQRNKSANAVLTLLPIMGFIIFFLGYLFFVATSFTSTVFARQFWEIFSVESGLNLGVIHQQQFYYVLGNIGDSFVLFLALIGIGIAIKQYASGSGHLSFVIIGLPSLLFLFFYFNNISQLIPDSRILLFWRLPILVSFFIIYMVTFGLDCSMNLVNRVPRVKTWLPALAMIIVIMISFFSLISPSVASDVNYIQKSADTGSTYFTDSELNAFSFIREKCNYDTIINGDYETLRDTYILNSGAFLGKRVITADLSNFTMGYLIFRFGELQKSGGLNLSLDGSWDNMYRYHITNSDPNIQESVSMEDCIYNDNDVQLLIPSIR